MTYPSERTQNFTDQTTVVARDTGTGFVVAGSAINNAAFSKITAGVSTWNIRIQRFDLNTDT